MAPGTLGNMSLQVALSKYYVGAKGRMKMADLPKKVLHIHMPQGAAKLQAVKVLVLEKIKNVHSWHCFHIIIWYIRRKM